MAALTMILAASFAQAQSSAVGKWELTTTSPEGTFVTQMEIRQEGDALVAVGKSSQGERPYDSVAVSGDRITLTITINYNGSGMVITYRGTVSGKEMSGDADFGGLASGAWSAVRQ